jgi:hypothetical protein
MVGMRSERGKVVVSTGVSDLLPYRFDSVEDADAFVGDLVTSFAFLGCDIVRD